MSSLFKFKQFQVDQTGTTMKINTDGVLLGALAEQKAANRILDIGTGTGVIAMMLAQRYPHAFIHAIEKDEVASELANKNFENSVFSARITGYCGTFQDFKPVGKYDLLVSNPPFFLKALQNPDKRKSQARHTNPVFFDALLEKAIYWLKPGGSLQLILPCEIAHYVLGLADLTSKFNHLRTIYLKSFSTSEPFRQIISLERSDQLNHQEHVEGYFTLYENKGVYSAEYRSLLQPFFLNF